MLKCNLCDFSTIKNNTKTRSDFQSSTLARATHRRLVEHKIRIHIKEEHAESLPDANYLKGKFYKENIIYLDEKGNVESSEPEKKTRGSPRTFSKKRKRAASWAPGNEKTGDCCLCHFYIYNIFTYVMSQHLFFKNIESKGRASSSSGCDFSDSKRYFQKKNLIMNSDEDFGSFINE